MKGIEKKIERSEEKKKTYTHQLCDNKEEITTTTSYRQNKKINKNEFCNPDRYIPTRLFSCVFFGFCFVC